MKTGDALHVGAQIINLESLGAKAAGCAEGFDKIQKIFSSLLELWKHLEKLFASGKDLASLKADFKDWLNKFDALRNDAKKVFGDLKNVKEGIKAMRELNETLKKQGKTPLFAPIVEKPDPEAAIEAAIDALSNLYEMGSAAREAWDSWEAEDASNTLADKQYGAGGAGKFHFTVSAAAGLSSQDMIRATIRPVSSFQEASDLTRSAGLQSLGLVQEVKRLRDSYDAAKRRIATINSDLLDDIANLKKTLAEVGALRRRFELFLGSAPQGDLSKEDRIRSLIWDEQKIANVLYGTPMTVQLNKDVELPYKHPEVTWASDEAYERQLAKDRARWAANDAAGR
jgi:hypothetical protein